MLMIRLLQDETHFDVFAFKVALFKPTQMGRGSGQCYCNCLKVVDQHLYRIKCKTTRGLFDRRRCPHGDRGLAVRARRVFRTRYEPSLTKCAFKGEEGAGGILLYLPRRP